MKATPTPMIPPIVSSDRQPPAALLGVSSSSASMPSNAAIPAASVRGSRWRPTSGPTAARQRTRAFRLTIAARLVVTRPNVT